MSALVEASGAQVLPPSGDARATVGAWQAHCAADADLRRVPVWAELAGRLHILGGEA